MDELTTTRMDAVTPLLSKLLGSQELAKHRAMIGLELEVLAKQVDRYGWDRDRGTPAHDRVMLDWMKALQDYPLPEVQDACQAAVLANPNKMPNYGHVVAEIIKARQRVVAAQPKRIETTGLRKPDDRSNADAILINAGFRPKTFGKYGAA